MVRVVAVLALLAVALATPSSGLEPGDLSASVAVATDYTLRGVSQSDEGPALQATVAVEHERGWFGVLRASTVDFSDERYQDDRDLEVDLELGWGVDLSAELGLVATVVRYEYPGSSVPYEYTELGVAAIVRDRVTLGASWVDDFYGLGLDSWVAEATGRWPVSRSFVIAAGVGYFDLDRLFGSGYWFWDAGVTWRRDRLGAHLSWIGTSGIAERVWFERADERLVGGLSWRIH